MKNKLFYTGVFLFLCILTDWAQNTTKEDPLNGPKKEFYPSGKLCKEYTVTDGVPNGVYKFYSEKGFLVAEQNIVDGIQQGIQKTFFDNGQVESEMNYEEGIPQGLKKEYYKNGTLKSESFLTGEPWELSGHANLYFEDGKLKAESKVSMGKLVLATTYDSQGRVTSEQKPGNIISYWYERDTGKKHTVINGVEQN